jgi:hypothetical protein
MWLNYSKYYQNGEATIETNTEEAQKMWGSNRSPCTGSLSLQLASGGLGYRWWPGGVEIKTFPVEIKTFPASIIQKQR